MVVGQQWWKAASSLFTVGGDWWRGSCGEVTGGFRLWGQWAPNNGRLSNPPRPAPPRPPSLQIPVICWRSAKLQRQWGERREELLNGAFFLSLSRSFPLHFFLCIHKAAYSRRRPPAHHSSFFPSKTVRAKSTRRERIYIDGLIWGQEARRRQRADTQQPESGIFWGRGEKKRRRRLITWRPRSIILSHVINMHSFSRRRSGTMREQINGLWLCLSSSRISSSNPEVFPECGSKQQVVSTSASLLSVFTVVAYIFFSFEYAIYLFFHFFLTYIYWKKVKNLSEKFFQRK